MERGFLVVAAGAAFWSFFVSDFAEVVVVLLVD
jgi:hypothetical protein